MGPTGIPMPSNGIVRPITAEELTAAGKKLPGDEAPSPDGVPNEIVRIFLKEDLDAMVCLFNVC